MKCNQSRPGFELVSPCLFPTMITVTLQANSLVYVHFDYHVWGTVEQETNKYLYYIKDEPKVRITAEFTNLNKENVRKSGRRIRNYPETGVETRVYFYKFNLLYFKIFSCNFGKSTRKDICPVGWGCRIYRLLLCRGVRPPPNECPVYDTK